MLTPQQIEIRRNRIGASEVPAALGIDEYKRWSDVIAAKLAPAREEWPSDAAKWGSLLEGPILEMLTIDYDVAWWRDEMATRTSALYPHMCASLDAISKDHWGPYAIEIKTLSERAFRDLPEPWNYATSIPDAPPVDGLPWRYLVQIHAQMAVTGMDHTVLVCAHYREPLKCYVVHRDQRVIDNLASALLTPWMQLMDCLEGADLPNDGGEARIQWAATKATPEIVEADPDAAAMILDLASVDEALSAIYKSPDVEALEARRRELTASLKALTAGQTYAGIMAGGYAFRTVRRSNDTDWKGLAKALGATPEQVAAYTKPSRAYGLRKLEE